MRTSGSRSCSARRPSKLGDHSLAVKAYGQAYTLDQTHLPTIQGLAEAHFALKDWEKASKFYQVLLMQHRDDLSPDEVVQAFHQLGVVKLEQGERRKALNMFDKALEQDPGHRRRSQRVIEIHGDDNAWDQVIHYKKQLLDGADAAMRLTLLQEIADLWQDKLDNRNKAIEAIAEAVSIEPKNHVLLHKLLQLYQETKQWKDATEIIQRVADLDERTAAKAKYAYTVGVIMRDELKDIGGRAGALQRGPRSRRDAAQALRGHQQAAHHDEGLEGPRARLPQDAASLDGDAEPGQGAAVQPVAQPRPDLSRPLEADGSRLPRPSRWPAT